MHDYWVHSPAKLNGIEAVLCARCLRTKSRPDQPSNWREVGQRSPQGLLPSRKEVLLSLTKVHKPDET